MPSSWRGACEVDVEPIVDRAGAECAYGHGGICDGLTHALGERCARVLALYGIALLGMGHHTPQLGLALVSWLCDVDQRRASGVFQARWPSQPIPTMAPMATP